MPRFRGQLVLPPDSVESPQCPWFGGATGGYPTFAGAETRTSLRPTFHPAGSRRRCNTLEPGWEGDRLGGDERTADLEFDLAVGAERDLARIAGEGVPVVEGRDRAVDVTET